jgi:hypothetical protein
MVCPDAGSVTVERRRVPETKAVVVVLVRESVTVFARSRLS